VTTRWPRRVDFLRFVWLPRRVLARLRSRWPTDGLAIRVVRRNASHARFGATPRSHGGPIRPTNGGIRSRMVERARADASRRLGIPRCLGRDQGGHATIRGRDRTGANRSTHRRGPLIGRPRSSAPDLQDQQTSSIWRSSGVAHSGGQASRCFRIRRLSACLVMPSSWAASTILPAELSASMHKSRSAFRRSRSSSVMRMGSGYEKTDLVGKQYWVSVVTEISRSPSPAGGVGFTRTGSRGSNVLSRRTRRHCSSTPKLICNGVWNCALSSCLTGGARSSFYSESTMTVVQPCAMVARPMSV